MDSATTPAALPVPPQAPGFTTPPGNGGAPYVPEDEPAFQVFIDSLNYLKTGEIQLIREAYLFSEAAHRGQIRLSGEPYITHPLAVAGALAEWHMDSQADRKSVV